MYYIFLLYMFCICCILYANIYITIIYIITHQFDNFDGYQGIGGLLVATRRGKGIIIRRRHFDTGDFCETRRKQLIN